MTSEKSAKGNSLIICLSPYSGGMEMDTVQLAQQLLSETKVILFVKHNCYIDRYYQDHLSNSSMLLETVKFKYAFSWSIIKKTRFILKKYNIKNVIFFGASELRSLYFAFLGYELNVIVRHGTTKSRPKKDWLHRLVYSCVNYHVAICQHLADNVKSIIPFAKKTQLKLIYPSLRKAPKLIQGGQREDFVRLLHVGRITDGKGQTEAIEACAILYENNILFQLDCVGELDPVYKNYFFGFIKSRPYANSINIREFTHDIAGYYQQAQIFIFPSKGEGLGNAFIEALSYGLVCVCYRNTVFPELQQLGFSFYMAEDQNIEDLKVKLLMAVRKVRTITIPIVEQSSLALSIFNTEREQREYLDLLQ